MFLMLMLLNIDNVSYASQIFLMLLNTDNVSYAS